MTEVSYRERLLCAALLYLRSHYASSVNDEEDRDLKKLVLASVDSIIDEKTPSFADMRSWKHRVSEERARQRKRPSLQSSFFRAAGE